MPGGSRTNRGEPQVRKLAYTAARRWAPSFRRAFTSPRRRAHCPRAPEVGGLPLDGCSESCGAAAGVAIRQVYGRCGVL